MTERYKYVEKFLNCLLVFLLPTQLALHFWPPFAFVFGIRVDYLAPTIYLTDILFLALFFSWLASEYKNFWLLVKKNKVYILAFLIIAVINTGFSLSPFPTLYKWMKICEMTALAFYVWARKDVFESPAVFKSLYLSMVFFSLIGIAQFFKGGTIGGLMYFLGERSFNLSTPGIALIGIGGKVFLRAYSTFPHPNALAGFLGAGVLILTGTYIKKIFSEKTPGLLIIFLAFLLTFSFSAFAALIFCGVYYLIFNKGASRRKSVVMVTLTFFLISLILPEASRFLLAQGIKYGESIDQRLELALISGNIVSGRFWTGAGLNTFVLNEIKKTGHGSPIWLLQPVHNIYLLVMSEVGIFGFLFLYIFFSKILRETSVYKVGFFLTIIFMMTTGLFDHYWLTLQQNMLLLALVIGNSFRAKS